MLGFEVEGGWRDVKASVVMTVLQYLMGGGGSFSAGGPGTASTLQIPTPHALATKGFAELMLCMHQDGN